MATAAVRETLATLTANLGPPSNVLYSGGSILARFQPGVTPAACDLDEVLAHMGAHIDHQVDASECGRVPLVRAGRIGTVGFHAQGGISPAGFAVRLFEAQRADGGALEAMLATERAVDAALAPAGDQREALMGYLASKLLLEPQTGSRLASDLARLVSDYMRGAAHSQRNA